MCRQLNFACDFAFTDAQLLTTSELHVLYILTPAILYCYNRSTIMSRPTYVACIFITSLLVIVVFISSIPMKWPRNVNVLTPRIRTNYHERALQSDVKNTPCHLVEQQPPQALDSRPHIIFILADDLGYNDVGYHNSYIRSPTIDELARNGVRLENYYVANMCSPSRAQLLTGRHQMRTGITTVIKPSWDTCLPLNEVTMAEVLKDAGYSTHLVGKWHLGHSRKECTPTKRGFDTFLGFLSGSEDYFSHMLFWKNNEKKSRGGYDFYENERPAYEYKDQYSSHIFARRTMDIIELHNTSQPLFIFLSFQAVHGPIEVPKEYIDQNRHFKNPERQTYAAMVTCMDEAIFNVTQSLKKRGIWDNTLLIFSTDNGGPVRDNATNQKLRKEAGSKHVTVSSNWPLRGGKGTNWEGGVRGAAFVHSHLLASHVIGTENRELMGLVDWLPTLAGHLGKGNIQNLRLDGYNIWKTIREGRKSPREELLHVVRVSADQNVHGAIRVGDWKLLHFDGAYASHEVKFGSHIAPPELMNVTTNSYRNDTVQKGKTTWLFNIKDDPLELNDLSQMRQEQTLLLKDHLTQYSKFIVDFKPPREDPNNNPALHNDTIGPWL